MLLFPADEDTRQELFSYLGVYGGTCHQLKEMIVKKPGFIDINDRFKLYFFNAPTNPETPLIPESAGVMIDTSTIGTDRPEGYLISDKLKRWFIRNLPHIKKGK